MVRRITVRTGVGFTPKDIPDALVGDCAFWYNEDSDASHQIYPQGGTPGSWGSTIEPQSSSMQVNLDKAGTYTYVCAVEGHGDEIGTITVT